MIVLKFISRPELDVIVNSNESCPFVQTYPVTVWKQMSSLYFRLAQVLAICSDSPLC